VTSSLTNSKHGSKKNAADVSLRSSLEHNEVLKRVAVLETILGKHSTALSHVAKMHDELEEIKEKEAELREIVLKLSAGQVLSPVEATIVAEQKSNTMKV